GVAARQSGDVIKRGRFAEQGAHSLTRYRRVVSFTADPARPALAGVDAAGRPFTQEWGWLGAEGDRRRRRYYVRRVTLRRPGREDVVVVTDLLDEAAYPAGGLVAAYLARWPVGNEVPAITQLFALRHLIGCPPPAPSLHAPL